MLRGLQSIGATAPEALMVGDSIFDLAAARAAGVDTAAALWGPFDRDRLAVGQPTYWVRHIGELLSLLNVDNSSRARGVGED